MADQQANKDSSEQAKIKVTVNLNGPLLVRGPLELVDQDGNPFQMPTGGHGMPFPGVIALCRCGRSENKPFCDSSHRTKTPPFSVFTRAV